MRSLMIALLLCMGSSAFSQVNYVLNPDFEEYSFCPQHYDQIYAAKHWHSLDTFETLHNPGQPEYCHKCGLSPEVIVPQNLSFYQYPRSGNGVALAQMFWDERATPSPLYYLRAYLQGRLYQKLTAGKTYCVSFYVNLVEKSGYGIKEIGAYLDNGLIDTTKNYGLPQTKYTPQVSNTGGVLTDTAKWVKIEGSFVAKGNEQFITIGNFRDKAGTTYTPIPFNGYNSYGYGVWYLVDDVSVIESDLKAYAGPDTHVGKGDSVYIGRPHEVGLECTWSVLGSTAVIGTGGGIWVKPAATTSYVVTQTLCGNVKKDTVRVEVWAAGVHSVNGQAQQYSLSPNPGNGILQLSQTSMDAQPVTLSVRESSGRLVYIGSVLFIDGKASLDVSRLAPGFYFLQLRDSHGHVYALRYVRQ